MRKSSTLLAWPPVSWNACTKWTGQSEGSLAFGSEAHDALEIPAIN